MSSQPPSGILVTRWPLLLLGAVTLAALAGFANTLGGYFIGDDFAYVGRFAAMSLGEWPRLFVREWSEGMWGMVLPELRPITALTFVSDAHLWGGAALGYRLTNLSIHIASAWLVGALAWRVSRGQPWCAYVAGLLFALHPAHAEPVTWITGRVDSLATFFYLGGIVAWLAFRTEGHVRWLVAAWLCYAGAAFSKEFGLTLPLMALLGDGLLCRAEVRRDWERAVYLYLGWIGIAAVYFLCRRLALSGGASGPSLALGSLVFWRELGQRQLQYAQELFSQFYCAPFGLGRAHGASLALLGGMLAGWFYLFWRARAWAAAVFFCGVAWYAVATLPLVVTYVSARHLYLASAGVCIAWALGLNALPRCWGLGLAVALIASYAVTLPTATKSWRASAQLSGIVAGAVRTAAEQAPADAALLVNAPETHEGAWMWSWACPFALRPPFHATDLTKGRVVLERPQLYLYPERWGQRQPFAWLARDARGAMAISVHGSGEKRIWFCPPEKLRPIAERIAATPEGPDTWQRFIDEITPSAP
ncbi:MAG: hypothetical protein HZA31_00775 [Opitutae bacterium]|nr:hypothetical protein [Opitutae bacterium]